MNKKAEKFDLLVADLNKGGNTWFTKEEMTDDLHTVVYHGRLDVHNHSLPVFIVVDDSAFSYARIAITTTSIDEKVIGQVIDDYQQKLFDNAYALIYQKLTAVDKQFLKAMAQKKAMPVL